MFLLTCLQVLLLFKLTISHQELLMHKPHLSKTESESSREEILRWRNKSKKIKNILRPYLSNSMQNKRSMMSSLKTWKKNLRDLKLLKLYSLKSVTLKRHWEMNSEKLTMELLRELNMWRKLSTNWTRMLSRTTRKSTKLIKKLERRKRKPKLSSSKQLLRAKHQRQVTLPLPLSNLHKKKQRKLKSKQLKHWK